MGLNLEWSYLAALVTQVFTWDGVHNYMLCLTHMGALWDAHFGDFQEKSTVLQQHHVVMGVDLVRQFDVCNDV